VAPTSCSILIVLAPVFEPVRPDLHITIVPGIGHIGMTVAPAGIAAVRKSFLDLSAPATG